MGGGTKGREKMVEKKIGGKKKREGENGREKNWREKNGRVFIDFVPSVPVPSVSKLFCFQFLCFFFEQCDLLCFLPQFLSSLTLL